MGDFLQKLTGPCLFGMGEELLRGGFLDHDTVFHKDGAGRDVAGKAHLVGDDQHGHALLCQLPHDGQHLAGQFRVEGAGGLVEIDDLGAGGKSAGDGHALLLTARQLTGVVVGTVGEADLFQHLHADGIGLCFGHPPGDDEALGDVLQGRFVAEEVVVLEDESRLAAQPRDAGAVGVGEVEGPRLDSIGMVWGNRKEIAWQHGFEVAKKYHDTYGNLMVPGKYTDPDGYPLGQWIIKTRQQKLNGSLKEERIAQLDEIGMVWNIFDAKWEKAYALAAAYYEENGNLNIPRSYVTAAGERLGQWVASQQWAYPKGKLTDEQVERLNRIGMYWGNRNDRQWNEGYQEAKRYFDAHGDLNVPINYVSPNGYALGKWVKRQRYTRQNPEKSGAVLTEERIAKLDEIEMRWETRNPKSQKSCLKLKEKVEPAKAG